jgi:hypothetical protein
MIFATSEFKWLKYHTKGRAQLIEYQSPAIQENALTNI